MESSIIQLLKGVNEIGQLSYLEERHTKVL